MVAHACNPSTWGAETGGSQVWGQPQQVVRLSNLPRPYFFLSFFFFLWYWGLNPGAFYLWVTPPAYFILFFLWHRVSLSCWGCPQTCDPPVSAYEALGSQACATTPSSLSFLYFIFAGAGTQGLAHARGAFYFRALLSFSHIPHPVADLLWS